jgi:hypothetical protein
LLQIDIPLTILEPGSLRTMLKTIALRAHDILGE